MKSFKALALLFSANALAQNPDSENIFPVILAGYTQDFSNFNIQASMVTFTNGAVIATLSCGSPDCPLTPSPTLALPSTGGYRLNLGTVATQTCSYGDQTGPGPTLVCIQSTSGVDTASQTSTYSGTDEIRGVTMTLTGGLDKLSSALSSIYPSGIPSGSLVNGTPIVTTTTPPAAATTTSTTSGGAMGSNTTTSKSSSTTGSTSTSATSSVASPSNAAGMIGVSYGGTLVGAVAGAFAYALL